MIESKKISLLRKARDQDGIIYLWSVAADLPYFSGHFPGMPILPAVACIDVSLEVIRRELELESAPYYQKIKTAKFTGVVKPGDEVLLNVSREENSWKILWSKEGVQTADIRLEFA
jgi:3-hydroxyacyl-[acyl-carrier-protein] dehydratase